TSSLLNHRGGPVAEFALVVEEGGHARLETPVPGAWFGRGFRDGTSSLLNHRGGPVAEFALVVEEGGHARLETSVSGAWFGRGVSGRDFVPPQPPRRSGRGVRPGG